MSEKTLTTSGTLSVGIQFEGAWHRDFVLRLPTVGDELDATDADVPDAGYGVALMAACLVSLGSVPPEAITYELLRGLLSEDYAQLTQARDDLKKTQARERQHRDFRHACVRLRRYGYTDEDIRALSVPALSGVLDAVLRIEHPKAWLKQQRGATRTYVSARRTSRKTPRKSRRK